MSDTITLLDGLLFTKPTTADVYTQDLDGVSCVKQILYDIPDCVNLSGAQVIFNGAYDPDGGRYHVRVLATKCTGAIIGVPSKTQNTIALGWTTVTPPAVVKSAEIDLTGIPSCALHIAVCQSSGTANTTGLEVIVRVRKKATVDEWTTLPSMIVLAAVAATKSDVGAETAAGQTVLGVTNPATGNLNHLGKLIFIEDTVTIAQCEVAFLVSQSGD
jgi:hypothetical protein